MRLFAAGGVVTALVLSVALPAQQNSTPTTVPSPVFASKISLPGLPHAGQVSANLYRGAQPHQEGYESLAKAGVKIVVDLRGKAQEDERRSIETLGMKYISIPGHCAWPKDQKVAAFLRVLRENPKQKVFVHCRLGDDRTGIMVAAYRMAFEGWSPTDAMREMQAWGFSTFHHGLCPGLADYEETFPERLRKGEAFAEWRDLTKPPPAPSTLQSH